MDKPVARPRCARIGSASNHRAQVLSRSVEKLLKSYPSDVQALAGKARWLILNLLPGEMRIVKSYAWHGSLGAHPGLNSAAAPRLVAANIHLDVR